MAGRNLQFLILIAGFTLFVSLISPAVVWADDGTPSPPDAPATEASSSPQSGTDAASQSVMTQASADAGSTDISAQPAVTQSVGSTSTDAVAVQPAGTPVPAVAPSTDVSEQSAVLQTPTPESVGQSTVAADETSAVAALAGSGSVLTGEDGQAIPLATTQAARALSGTDPWFDAGGGVIVGYSPTGVCSAGVTECHASSTPIQAAIDDVRSIGRTVFIEQGAYNEDVSISKKLVMTGLGSGATANSFTLNGGADVTGSGNIFAPLVFVNPGAKIQNGIDLVGSGGTVSVAPGNYNESLSISRPLKLRSAAGAASTIIDGGDPYSVFISSRDVTLDGFTITNPGYTGASDASGIVVEPLPYGPNADIRITNNIIHDIGSPARASVAYGTVGINIGAADGVEIDHNQIYNIVHSDPAAWANGISIWGGDSSTPSGNITIHDNSFHDIFSPYPADAGISTQTDVGTVTVYNNSFYNMDEYAIEVRDTNIVNAVKNWWGDAGGPKDASAVPDACGLVRNNPAGIGGPVTPCVIYDPWLTVDPLAGGAGTGAGGSASAGVSPVVPVTGGVPAPIGCDSPSVTSRVGDIQVTFTGLCGYEVVLAQFSKDSLLGSLSPGDNFVEGISYVLLKNGKAVDSLPAGAGIRVSFPKPAGNASVFAWIDSSWVVQPASVIGDRVVTNFNIPFANAVIVH